MAENIAKYISSSRFAFIRELFLLKQLLRIHQKSIEEFQLDQVKRLNLLEG